MKKKCIIVDGPDCTGKTTLCEKLSDMYNIPIYHLTYYEDPERHYSQFKQATEMMLDWIRNGHEGGFILDRYILSEYAYRNVYRPEVPLVKDADLMMEILEHRAALGEIEVIITLPEDKERWFEAFKKAEQEREEMYTSEKISKVYDEYLNLWKKLRYNKNVLRYDMFENMSGKNKNTIIQL
jgi:thymidylate kinase